MLSQFECSTGHPDKDNRRKKLKMYGEEDRSDLEDLLDSLELLSERKDDQRAKFVGSDVRLNVYDMVRR